MKDRFDKRFFMRSSDLDWKNMEINEFIGYIKPKCAKIEDYKDLIFLLNSGRKLKVKYMVDPINSEFHLGDLAPLILVDKFYRAGHVINLVFGDFTTLVGNPEGRDNGGNPLSSSEEIAKNIYNYIKQFGKYIDFSKVNVHYNSTWLGSMGLKKIFDLFKLIKLKELISHNDSRKQGKKMRAVSLTQMCYGTFMGIDSVHLMTDIEIGSISQSFNFCQCRRVMSIKGIKKETILMTPILDGLHKNGREMNKINGNHIDISCSLQEKFGKIMLIHNKSIFEYFCLFADIYEDELSNLEKFIMQDPLEAKKQLATLVVALETTDFSRALNEREIFESNSHK